MQQKRRPRKIPDIPMSSFAELPKAYDASAVEDEIYAAWERSGVFHPENLPDQSGDPYCIVMPPPNRTGTLHMGHATMLAIEDLLIRFHRMRGKRALWIPGTDHAAIATQVKVEQLLVKQGMKDPRKELGREKFVEKVVEFAEESASTIRNQVRKMGSSCDWSREKYTLDDERNRAVNRMFQMMVEDGVIERGYRVVNWDPQFQTTLSDDEVLSKEVTAKLLTFTYDKDFPIAISTTRPETKFGDTAVAVHPSDERYAQYVGKIFTPTFCGKQLSIKVIADEAVDPAFGTGALGVTPAHSMIDADMAGRHSLPTVIVIGPDGRLLPEAGEEFMGLTVIEAREKIQQMLAEQGVLKSVEEIPQNLPIAERGGAPVEQLPMRQWFIRVNKPFALRQDTLGKWKKGEQVTLKESMIEAVQSGQTRIVPDRFDKTYFHWINNLRDWCISRQIWFGHRIPVWYNGEDWRVSDVSPGEGWVQDPDTLDTWFSAGMWTFSTLGWPQTKVIFVRHGEAGSNAAGVLDDDGMNGVNGLTPKGREQIEKTAERLKGEGAVKIIASPLQRTKETAEILAARLGLEVAFDETIREVGVGQWNHRLERDFLEARKTMDWHDASPDGVESYAHMRARCDAFMRKLIAEHVGETVIVVSHGDPIRVMGTYHTDQEWTEENPANGETMMRQFANDGSQTDELKAYHPTAVLETGYDILFFWVARMILMSTYALGDVPFKDVYLHGLVRDEQGRKMSKSLGNILDPLDLIPKYGTDAVRLSLLIGTTPGQDMKLSEEKIAGFRNFTNKLWNISRFILMQIGDAEVNEAMPKTLADRWILSRLAEVTTSVTQKIERYEFSSAGEELRDFTWGDLADWYLEIAKIEKGKEGILRLILQTVLKLWHPFMPFVTESTWKQAGFGGQLIVARWPSSPEKVGSVSEFELLRQLITDCRRLRSENGVEPAKMVELSIVAASDARGLIEQNIDIVKALARASEIGLVTSIEEGWTTTISGASTIGLNLAGTVDLVKERAKIEKEIAETEKYLVSTKIKLENQEFISKAPPKVKEDMEKKLAEAQAKLAALQERMQKLA